MKSLSCRVFSACSILLACGGQSGLSEAELESLCERNSNLQDVERYDGSAGVSSEFVLGHRRAVGLLRFRTDLSERYFDEAGNVSGQGWCTGTLIDDDLFLTAGHCIDAENTGSWKLPHDKGGVTLRPAELAREFVVEFHYEVSAQTNALALRNTVEVVRLEEHRLRNVDYAILRLSGHPGLTNGVARISPDEPKEGDTVAILQHPAAAPMKVGAGPVARVQGSRISYDRIDTLGGSSGAGILDAHSGKLVGIHTNGGCTKSGGGENYGVTIGALTAASPTLAQLVDRSRNFLVGDWDNNGTGDLAVFNDGCFYPDADGDGKRDPGSQRCPENPDADTYFSGRWEAGHASGLGWRSGSCVYLDVRPKQPLCYGDAHFQVVIADWNGDGQSDIGVQRGNCIEFDTDLDGTVDQPSYCVGNGLDEDEYLSGSFDGSARDSIAVRRGNNLFYDLDRDGNADATPRVFGKGGEEDQYLVGDWNGDHRADLAVRRKFICLMNKDASNDIIHEGRVFDDFWSAP